MSNNISNNAENPDEKSAYQTRHLEPGDVAPAFSLPAALPDEVKEISLAELANSWVVLYIYPKDDTPGCTTEACDFENALNVEVEDKQEGLEQLQDCVVLGLSPDDVASHQAFAQKYDLNFALLSDEDMEVIKLYGGYGEKSMYGKKTMGILRSTFIISPQGKIVEALYNVRAKGHVARVAKLLAKHQAS